ncbi:MAG: flagellar basal-body MS-ring/collar protein FliF [Planctomycetota bacterium]
MSDAAQSTPPSLLPPAVSRVFAGATERLSAISRPARILLATTGIAALVLAGWLTWRANNENWGVLFSQLERDDAAALVAKLRELKVPYRLREEGAAIDVPEARVHELRLELASAGLPRGGGVGFESFDRMRLGATEFEQRVLYRRSMEGELARSISSLSAVQSARVHLVMPERSVFVSRSDPASASVVVRLRPGNRLGGAEVAGIVHLVASSVPSLSADRVTLVTTSGEMLHRSRTDGDDATAGLDDDRRAQHRAMETTLEDRVRAMLERVVGDGHADVRVSVDLDLARVEHTEDHYDRATTALRSEDQTVEMVSQTGTISVAGVPGAESNLGGNPPPTPADAGGPVLREHHTRNYEVDHVSERRVATQGSVKRITVAVIIDGVVRNEGGRATVIPRERVELDRLVTLVRGAIGANTTRGDVVTVESIPFHETIDANVAAAAAARQRPRAAPARPRWTWKHTAGVVGVALVLVMVAAVALRRRRALAQKSPRVLSDMPPGALPGSTPEGLPEGSSASGVSSEAERESLRSAAHARAAADPATAALVLRYWLGAEGAERKN